MSKHFYFMSENGNVTYFDMADYEAKLHEKWMQDEEIPRQLYNMGWNSAIEAMREYIEINGIPDNIQEWLLKQKEGEAPWQN